MSYYNVTEPQQMWWLKENKLKTNAHEADIIWINDFLLTRLILLSIFLMLLCVIIVTFVKRTIDSSSFG